MPLGAAARQVRGPTQQRQHLARRARPLTEARPPADAAAAPAALRALRGHVQGHEPVQVAKQDVGSKGVDEISRTVARVSSAGRAGTAMQAEGAVKRARLWEGHAQGRS